MRPILAGLAAAASLLCLAGTEAPPYRVAPDLFDQSAPDLGLTPAPGTETFTIFRPGEDTDRFSNGVVLISFRGRLYAQWQSSARDEDSPDTWVAYSASRRRRR